MELLQVEVPAKAEFPCILVILASIGLFALYPSVVLWKTSKKEHVELLPYTILSICMDYNLMCSAYVSVATFIPGVEGTSQLHVACFTLYSIIALPVYFVISKYYQERFEGSHLENSLMTVQFITCALLLGLACFVFLVIKFHTMADYIMVIFVVFGIIMYASPMPLIMSIYRGEDVDDYMPSWFCASLLLYSVAWVLLACTTLDINFYFTLTNWIGMLLSLFQLGVISLLSMESEQHPPTERERENPQAQHTVLAAPIV